jgi:hypothetical protein
MRRITMWAGVAAGAAIAALGAADFVGAGLATGEAAASTSPYAGSYTGEVRYGGGCTDLCFKPYWTLSVTISNSGKVSGVANYFENAFWGVYQSPSGDGSAIGSISDGGKLRLTVKEGGHSEKFSGVVTLGASGEIYLTDYSGLTKYLTLIPQ